MENTYRDIILTKHAVERMSGRLLDKHCIYDTIHQPDTHKGRADLAGNHKFIKNIKGRNYHVVATYLKRESKWLVISAWVRGENDQRPIAEQLVLLPFRIIWWLLKLAWKGITNASKATR